MKHLLCCLAVTASALADTPELMATRIDDALARDHLKALEQQRKHTNSLPPEIDLAVADDSVFLRRACIDIAGRLPAADEVRKFLADQTPDKRARLADALVQEPGAVQVRFRMLSEAFRVKENDAYAAWLLKAAEEDRPFDQIISSLISEGHLGRRDEENAFHTANEVAAAVLGEDLNCALCHNHPYNAYTQKQYYEFAACFIAPGNPALSLPRYYHQGHGKPGDLVKPELLRLTTREPPPAIKRNMDPRAQVAKWITTESSHRFARVAALRVWSSLFGMPGIEQDKTIGGIDPAPSWKVVNEIMSFTYRGCDGAQHPNPVFWLGLDSPERPAPQVFHDLSAEFRRCGCRIGVFQRVLARTGAYNRAAFNRARQWYIGNLIPAPLIRRLPAEIIWDVLSAEKAPSYHLCPPWNIPCGCWGVAHVNGRMRVRHLSHMKSCAS